MFWSPFSKARLEPVGAIGDSMDGDGGSGNVNAFVEKRTGIDDLVEVGVISGLDMSLMQLNDSDILEAVCDSIDEAEKQADSVFDALETEGEDETEKGSEETAKPTRTKLRKTKARPSPIRSARPADQAENAPRSSSKSARKSKSNSAKTSNRD